MTVTIGGNVSVSNGATLIANINAPVTAKVTGNWTNNGTFSAGAGTVTFNKSGTATYGGSSTTPFNNLTVNAGTTAGCGYEHSVQCQRHGDQQRHVEADQERQQRAPVAFLNLKNQAGTTDKYFGVYIATTNNLGSTIVSVSGNQICSVANGMTRSSVASSSIQLATASSDVTFYYSFAELQTGQTPTSLKAWHYNAGTWSQAGTTTTASACASGISCSVALTGVSAYGAAD